MAEVRRLILDHYGPSATLDNLLDGIEIYTSDPDCIKELDEFLARLRKNCRYYDSLNATLQLTAENPPDFPL
jgi:hypothetical protein